MKALLTPFIIGIILGVLFITPVSYFGVPWNMGPADVGFLFFNSDASSSVFGKNDKNIFFPEVFLEAKSAIVQEYPGGATLFEKNPDVQLPLASLVKLMTAFTAKEIFLLEPPPFPVMVRMSQDAIMQEGDSGFYPGEEFFAHDLLDAMLVASSNDAAFALAERAGLSLSDLDPEQAFINYMNRRAKELELSRTYFLNATGLDENEQISGGYSTVKDVALLLKYLLSFHPGVVEKTISHSFEVRSVDGVAHTITNSNEFASSLPGLIASKTGFTDLAGGNLAVVADIGFGHTVVMVVIGSTFEGRFRDIMALYYAAVEYYRQK